MVEIVPPAVELADPGQGGVVFRADHFREMIEALPIPLYMTDAGGVLTYYNAAASTMWGRSPVIGEERWGGAHRLYGIDGGPMADEDSPLAVTLKTGRPVLGENAIAERPDGTRYTFTPFPSPLVDGGGTIVGAVTMLFDTSAWRAAEQATHHLAAIVESSDDAIISKDLDGTIRSWNRAAERLFGYTSEEMIGKSILMIIPPDRRGEETEIIERIRNGGSVEHYETVRRQKSGAEIEISLTVSPVRNAQGRIVGASKIARDITDRRRTERVTELLLNEIKHRVKNTLSTVQAMASQTFRRAPPEELEAFVARLHAMARAHDVLTQREWDEVSLAEMATQSLKPFCDRHQSRIASGGPDAMLSPNRALLLAMILHELGTNAVKHGALSNSAGTVDLRWQVSDRDGQPWLSFVWREQGGPPVTAPTRRGFGSRMIEHAVKGDRGHSEFAFDPSGLVCTVDIPI